MLLSKTAVAMSCFLGKLCSCHQWCCPRNRNMVMRFKRIIIISLWLINWSINSFNCDLNCIPSIVVSFCRLLSTLLSSLRCPFWNSTWRKWSHGWMIGTGSSLQPDSLPSIAFAPTTSCCSLPSATRLPLRFLAELPSSSWRFDWYRSRRVTTSLENANQ